MTVAENSKPRPTAFVGSSSESRGIAEAILQNLEGKVEITCWYHDFFEPTSSVIDDLVAKIGRFDFGIFIFAPDDVVQIRQHSAGSVRDNVLFELGLFLGRLGMQRVFIVAHPDFQDTMRVPTDLLGRNLVSFTIREDGNLVAALETSCRKLYDAMKKAGPKAERLRELEGARERIESAEPPIWDLAPPDFIVAEKQIGAASFVVINDDIRNANTEVIVSSDDNHFTARGGVSKAILAKVGPDVRRQLDLLRKAAVSSRAGSGHNRRRLEPACPHTCRCHRSGRESISNGRRNPRYHTANSRLRCCTRRPEYRTARSGRRLCDEIPAIIRQRKRDRIRGPGVYGRSSSPHRVPETNSSVHVRPRRR